MQCMWISPTVGFPRNSLTVKIVIGALTRLKFFTRSKNIKMQTALTWKRAFGFFELAQQAATLYEKQEMKEKRRILDFLFSNCLWKDGDLIPNFRKPFDILALTNSAYQTRKAASRVKSGLSETWLPRINAYRTLLPTVGPGMVTHFDSVANFA